MLKALTTKFTLPGKTSGKQLFFEYGQIILGSFIMAAGYVFFINPYNIVPGGIISMGIVVHHLIPEISVGIFNLVVNIPLLLIGIKILGPKFGIKTVLGIVLTSVFMDVLTYYIGENDPLELANDLLLSCIFGSIMIGFGLGLIFRSRATTGGSDILAMIMSKFTHITVGQAFIIVDSAIVLIALVVFKDWKIPLYSWLVIYVTGQVIDITLKGFRTDNAVMIVSKMHQEIKEFIMYKMERGGTYLKGEGMYTGEQKNVIFVVISRRELPILKELIHRLDKDAFVTVLNTSETLGDGFKSLTPEEN